MSTVKLQKLNKKTTVTYSIVLPKQLVEEIARWPKGMDLEVEWIEKGKNTTMDKPYFRISRPDNLWSKKIGGE